MSHFITYLLNHCTTPLYQPVVKSTKLCLYLRQVILIVFKNYRPISLLLIVSKVLDRLIFNKIISHISKSISPSQFSFTKNCSTLQQMLSFSDQIIIIVPYKQMSFTLTSARLLIQCHIVFYWSSCGQWV